MQNYHQTTLLTNVSELQTLIEQTVQKAIKGEFEKSSSSDELLNTAQIAEFLKVSSQTIWKWVKNNKIPYLKINRRHYFNKNAVIKKIEESNQISRRTR